MPANAVRLLRGAEGAGEAGFAFFLVFKPRACAQFAMRQHAFISLLVVRARKKVLNSELLFLFNGDVINYFFFYQGMQI